MRSPGTESGWSLNISWYLVNMTLLQILQGGTPIHTFAVCMSLVSLTSRCMSDAVCADVCVCVSFAWEVGVYFVLRCLHEPFLLYLKFLVWPAGIRTHVLHTQAVTLPLSHCDRRCLKYHARAGTYSLTIYLLLIPSLNIETYMYWKSTVRFWISENVTHQENVAFCNTISLCLWVNGLGIPHSKSVCSIVSTWCQFRTYWIRRMH